MSSSRRFCASLLCLATSAAAARAGDLAYNNGAGGVEAMLLGGAPRDVSTMLRVPLKGWRASASQETWGVRDVKYTEEGQTRRWTGVMSAGREAFAYEHVQRNSAGRLELDLEVVSQSDADHEGVYLFINLPVDDYAGGVCRATAAGEEAGRVSLPEHKPNTRHLLGASCDQVVLAAPDDGLELNIRFQRRVDMNVQDNREWKSPTYSVYVRFHDGRLPRGTAAAVKLTMQLTGETEAEPVRLEIEPRRKLYDLDGFGGNYCFGIESPVTDYTLEQLDVACARVEMTLAEWEPTNDNASPSETDWEYFRSRVSPGTNLHREFRLAERIHAMGIPYGISAWRMPKWLLPDKGRHVARRLWPEMLESVCAYLVWAKREHGVEPDWFSFNEPDIGVDVRFSPEEHRDAVKMFGRRFGELGLRTKLLLADVCHPRGSHAYAMPTVADPNAIGYLAAVAFHSWGGATRQQYAAWADLALKLDLPLYVTEAGVDAHAWRTQWYIDSYRYAMREVEHYQQLLLFAKPRGTMHWEFTSDYGLADVRAEGVRPKKRFWFMKHLCDLTPRNSRALATSSTTEDVLATAFEDDRGRFAMHVANMGAQRRAFVFGIPRAARTLSVRRTSETQDYAPLRPLNITGSSVVLQLAPQSLTTLTSEPPASRRATRRRP